MHPSSDETSELEQPYVFSALSGDKELQTNHIKPRAISGLRKLPPVRRRPPSMPPQAVFGGEDNGPPPSLHDSLGEVGADSNSPVSAITTLDPFRLLEKKSASDESSQLSATFVVEAAFVSHVAKKSGLAASTKIPRQFNWGTKVAQLNSGAFRGVRHANGPPENLDVIERIEEYSNEYSADEEVVLALDKTSFEEWSERRNALGEAKPAKRKLMRDDVRELIAEGVKEHGGKIPRVGGVPRMSSSLRAYEAKETISTTGKRLYKKSIVDLSSYDTSSIGRELEGSGRAKPQKRKSSTTTESDDSPHSRAGTRNLDPNNDSPRPKTREKKVSPTARKPSNCRHRSPPRDPLYSPRNGLQSKQISWLRSSVKRLDFCTAWQNTKQTWVSTEPDNFFAMPPLIALQFSLAENFGHATATALQTALTMIPSNSGNNSPMEKGPRGGDLSTTWQKAVADPAYVPVFLAAAMPPLGQLRRRFLGIGWDVDGSDAAASIEPIAFVSLLNRCLGEAATAVLIWCFQYCWPGDMFEGHLVHLEHEWGRLLKSIDRPAIGVSLDFSALMVPFLRDFGKFHQTLFKYHPLRFEPSLILKLFVGAADALALADVILDRRPSHEIEDATLAKEVNTLWNALLETVLQKRPDFKSFVIGYMIRLPADTIDQGPVTTEVSRSYIMHYPSLNELAKLVTTFRKARSLLIATSAAAGATRAEGFGVALALLEILEIDTAWRLVDCMLRLDESYVIDVALAWARLMETKRHSDAEVLENRMRHYLDTIDLQQMDTAVYDEFDTSDLRNVQRQLDATGRQPLTCFFGFCRKLGNAREAYLLFYVLDTPLSDPRNGERLYQKRVRETWKNFDTTADLWGLIRDFAVAEFEHQMMTC